MKPLESPKKMATATAKTNMVSKVHMSCTAKCPVGYTKIHDWCYESDYQNVTSCKGFITCFKKGVEKFNISCNWVYDSSNLIAE
jgi:hypothetical protein